MVQALGVWQVVGYWGVVSSLCPMLWCCQLTSRQPDCEIKAVRLQSLGLAMTSRPQSHWFFSQSGFAGVSPLFIKTYHKVEEFINMESNSPFGFDNVVSVIAGLGVPGLVLLIAMEISGWAGAAALTAALAALGGPFGMLGGIAVLGILALISKSLTEFGLEKVFYAVINRMEKDGQSKEIIYQQIVKLPISTALKRKSRDMLFGSGDD